MPNQCPRCEAPLSDDAPGGLCPRCLMGNALGSDADVTYSFVSGEPGRVLEVLSHSVGPMPRVLLPDTGAGMDEQPLIKPSSDQMPPATDRSSRVQLLGEIARGGMGAVLKGRDPDLGRDLAVKVLLEAHRDRPDFVRRFVEEAQIGGQLQHPGIVPVYELGTFGDSRPYFTMKLVKGRTLADLVAAREGPLDDLARFLGIFEQVAQTVAYAHARGVIHRDLKPSNVMVGSFGEVQVMDWGLAKVLPRGGVTDDASAGKVNDNETVVATARSGSDTDLSHAGSVMGTPSYMAPEQARGEIDRIDERADVFALGSILCEVLTGFPAFTGRSSGEIQRLSARGDLSAALDRLPRCGADPALIALTVSCLAAERDDRPGHAGDIAERIGAYRASVQERLRLAEIARAEERARAEEATKRARVELDRRRLTVALAVSVIGLVLLGGGGWAYLAKQRATRQTETERVVNAAIDEATLLRGRAKEAGVGDLSKWSDVLAATRRARALLDAGESDMTLRGRVERLTTLLEQEQAEYARRAEELGRDQRFVERLEAIRFENLERVQTISFQNRESRSPRLSDAAYSAAFGAFGIDPDRLGPAESGRRLLTRHDPEELASFLDDWALARRSVLGAKDTDSWPRLIDAARAADPDPWRNALRDHLRRGESDSVRRLAADEKAMEGQPTRSLILLARVLLSLRQDDGVANGPTNADLAVKVLKRAWRLRPDDFWTCMELASWSSPEEKVPFSVAAVALRPQSAAAHLELANSLPSESHDESVMEYKAAIRIKPDAWFYHEEFARYWLGRKMAREAAHEFREAIRLGSNEGVTGFDEAYLRTMLGFALNISGNSERAVEELRRAVRISDALGMDLMFTGSARVSIVRVLLRNGETDAALEEARGAMRSKPNHAYFRHLLGDVQQERGELNEAIDAYREAVRIEPSPGEFDPQSALERVQKLLELENRLDEILRGRNVPAGVDERLEVAKLCGMKGHFVAAARFYREAFEAKPSLADDLSWLRLHAAIAAARAGADRKGTKDVPPIDEAERALWRAQALAWLGAEKNACSALLPADPSDKRRAREALDTLTHHRDLACVRDEARLKELPEVERNDWIVFWAEAGRLLAGPETMP